MNTKAGKQSPRVCLDTSILFSSSVLIIFDFIFSIHFFFAPPNFFDSSDTLVSESSSEMSGGFFGECPVARLEQRLSPDL